MPKTLLLADDSITIQRVVGITFANEDYEITTVDNGDDAVMKAKELKPDVVLADVIMPKKNGYEVCQAIKSDPELAHIPVLLLAGTFEAFDEARARDVGANGHITKPFESQALIDKVNELVAGGGAAAPAPRPRPVAQPAAATVPAQPAIPPRAPAPASPAIPPRAPAPASPVIPPRPAPVAAPAPRPAPQPAAAAPMPSRPIAAPGLTPLQPKPVAPQPVPLAPRPVVAPIPPPAAAAPRPVAPAPMALEPEISEPLDPSAAEPLDAAGFSTPMEPDAFSPEPVFGSMDDFASPDLPPAAPPPAFMEAAPQSAGPDVADTSWLGGDDIGEPLAPEDEGMGFEPQPMTLAEIAAERVAQENTGAMEAIEVDAGGDLDSGPELVPAHEFVPELAAGAASADISNQQVSQLAKEIIERIAWEVIPKLAETILREEIEKLVREKLSD